MKRKLIASLLCLCMLVSLLPVAAFAVPEAEENPIADTTDTQEVDENAPTNESDKVTEEPQEEPPSTPAPVVIKAPLGDKDNATYTPDQLNIAGYTATAVEDTASKADDVTAVYDVTVTHPALLKHKNGAGTEGLWIGIGAKINTKGTGTNGNEGKNGTGSSYFAFVTDKTNFTEIATIFKEKDWAGQGVAGYSEYGWRQNDGTYVFQWYSLADTTKYKGKTPYLVERNPKTEGDETTYTYNVYRINFDVTEGHLVTITPPTNGTLDVKAGNKTVATNTPVGEGTNLTITATPSAHYQLKSVSANGIELSGTNGVYNVKMASANVTISAAFEQIERTVTFNANGGKFGTDVTKAVKVTDGATVGSGSIPTPTNADANKVFMGWGTSANATETVDLTTTTVTADATYYAVWQDKVTTGISAGFKWNGDDANAAINADIKRAGKAKTINDSIDQTYWLLVNSDMTNSTTKHAYEIKLGNTILEAGVMTGADGATGIFYDSFLMANHDPKVAVKAGDVLTFALYEGADKTGTPVTQTVTVPANPLTIESAEVTNIASKTINVKFSDDLLGRYVIEVKKGNKTVATASTECDRADGASNGKIAKDEGITLTATEALTAGTYTATIRPNIDGAAVYSNKDFTLSDTISSVKVMEGEVEFTVLTAAANETTHKITLSGKIANPANKTLKLIALGTDGAEVGTIESLTLTYNSSATPKFSIADTKLTTILGTEYTVELGVVTAVDTTVAKPDTSASTEGAKLPAGTTQETIDALKAAASSVTPNAAATTTLTNLATDAAAAVDEVKDDTHDTSYDADKAAERLVAAGVTGANVSNTKVVVQPYLDVQVKEYTVDAATSAKTLELDITAQYRVLATTASNPASDALNLEGSSKNAVDITKSGEDTKLTVTQPITLTVTLPEGFKDADGTIYVLHKGAHYHAGTYTSSSKELTFTSNDGLSPFVIDSSATMVAKIGDTFYKTLQDAVDAVTAGGTIDVVGNASSETIKVSKNFSLTKSGAGVFPATGNFEAASGYNAPTATLSGDGSTLTVVAGTKQSGGGSGGGGVSSNVTIDRPTNGKVSVSPTAPSKGATVTITLTPDTGYVVGSVTVTDKDGKAVELTKVSDTKYTFTMPDGKVKVAATFTKAGAEGFTDVPADAYYADAVKWAVEKGITNGLTATTFGPNNSCTRGQMVTFLWRAAGSPAATGTNSFSDVASGEYYYNAVLWAVEKGITNGTSATTFSPNATVNRGQTVTFLYRYAESPAATGESSFTDVAADAFYADAVKWAVAEEITNGTSSTTFSPASNCTRGQIVTFMYRQMAE